jgi:hypothetical protein
VARHPSHRGPAPEDARLFSEKHLPALRAATRDLCWLLDHGYASRSSIALTGNRYNLAARQRMAVSRCSCSAEAARVRQSKRIELTQLAGRELWIDGYNVLTILESALSGGVVLLGRDGCYRDIAGIHKRYRKVNETIPALELIAEFAALWKVSACRWWLDKPVSNSGRLKTLIHEIAAASGWNMTAELVFNPDRVLSESSEIVATSDGIVLDRCHHWINLAQAIIEKKIPGAWVLDLARDAEAPQLARPYR